MIKPCRYTGICLAFGLLSACSSTPETKPALASLPLLPHSELLVQASAEVPDLEQIFGLTAQQRQTFLRYFNAPEHQELPARKRLYNFCLR